MTARQQSGIPEMSSKSKGKAMHPYRNSSQREYCESEYRRPYRRYKKKVKKAGLVFKDPIIPVAWEYNAAHSFTHILSDWVLHQ